MIIKGASKREIERERIRISGGGRYSRRIIIARVARASAIRGGGEFSFIYIYTRVQCTRGWFV